MFNYSEGYPIVDFRPSAGLLRPTEYMPLQAAAAYGGDDLKVLDPSSITDPLKWGRTEVEEVETYNQYYALQNYMLTTEGGMTGISHYINFADEPLKGFVIRQAMKQHPTKPWQYNEESLTPEALAEDQKTVDRLTDWRVKQSDEAVKAGLTVDVDRQISELMTKLAYASAKKSAKDKLGFSWLDLVDASNVFWGWAPFDLLAGDETIPGNTEDIEKRLSAYDPNFNPRSWFAKNFPSESTQFYGALENGISVETILDSPNADHAMYRIMSILNTNDIQKRMSTYKPTTMDQLRLFRDTFVGGMINSPGEMVLGTTVELGLVIGGAALGSGTAPGPGTIAGGVAGGLAAKSLSTAGLFARLKRVYDAASKAGTALRAARYTTETLYKLPFGVMPSYVANYGLIRGTAASFGFGVVQGTIAEASRQQREIAFGIATLNANPYAQADYDLSEIVSQGLQSGLVFGGTFGLGLGLARTGFGALRNRLSGVVVDPKLNVRDLADRRFSLEGTPLGKTIDNFRNKFSKPLIDAPVPEKLAKESIINKEAVTPEKLSTETEARVERAETREVVESPTAAKSTPEDLGTRRYVNESIPDYLARVGPAKAVVNIVEFLSSVAQRTRVSDNAALIDESQQFAHMGYGDQLRVVLGSDTHLAEARRIETESVGLTPERERVYNELNAARRAWIKELKKKLTDLEYTSIINEWKGASKRSTKDLPSLIAAVRDKARPTAERQAALREVALNILETARKAANDKDAAETLRNSVPEEFRNIVDAAVLEQKLNNGVIANSLVEEIYVELVGRKPRKPVKKTFLSKAIERATIASKFDTERLAQIKAVLENPENFLQVAKGNTERIAAFYDFVAEGVSRGIISSEYQTVLLASVVHLNFDAKVWNIKFKYGTLSSSKLAGEYRGNTIIINDSIDPKYRWQVPKTLLHEIGHAYFTNYMSGSGYLKLLQAFNRLHYSEKFSYFSMLAKDSEDSLLNSSINRTYILQNMEEFAVETWAKIMLSDTTEALNILKPAEVSLLQSILDKVADGLIVVANLINTSESYHLVKEVLNEVTSLNTSLNSKLSVTKVGTIYHDTLFTFTLYARGTNKTTGTRKRNENLTKAELAEVLPERIAELHRNNQTPNAEVFNKRLLEKYPESYENLKVTQEELNLLFNNYTEDSLFAFVVAKSFGKPLITASGPTKNFLLFIETLTNYKKAQLANARLKLATILNSPYFGEILALSKKDQEEFFAKYILYPDGVREYPKTLSTDLLRLLGRFSLPVTYSPLMPDSLGSTFNSNRLLVSFLESLSVSDTNELSKARVQRLISELQNNVWITSNNITLLKTFVKTIDVPDLLERITAAEHRAFLTKLSEEENFSLFSGVDENAPNTPHWSTKEGALSILSMMLEAKLNRPQIKALLNNNIDPNLVDALLTRFDEDSKVLNAINDLITQGKVTFNEVTKQWTLSKSVKESKPVKKKPTKKPTKEGLITGTKPEPEVVATAKDPKVVASAKKAALETDSVAVTADNLQDMLTLMANERLGNSEVLGKIFLGPKGTLKKIASGEIKTLTDLIKYTKGFTKKEQQADIGKTDTKKLQKAVEKGAMQGGTEGQKAISTLARDRAEATQAEQRELIFSMFLDYNKELMGRLFTPEETALLEKLNEFTTNEELGKALGVSTRTAGNRRSAMLARIQTMVSEAGIKAGDAPEFIVESLENYVDKLEETTTTTKPSKTLEQQIKADNKAPETPPKIPEAKAAKAAAKMVADVTKEQKLQNTNPEPVPVISETAPTKDTLYRATSEATQNTAEAVLRPEKQVDALIAQSTDAVKEVVEFTPKNPIKIDKNLSDMSDEAVEKLVASFRGLLDGADDTSKDVLSGDAIIFADGSILPLTKEEVKVLGKTTIKVDPSKPTQATLTIEGKVPTVKVEPAKPTTEKVEDAPFVTTKHPAPKPTEAKVYPKESVPLDKVETSATEKLERKTNSDPLLLRANGMDTNFLRLFVKRFLGSKLEPEALTILTDKFKYLWTQFVIVNRYIADANRLALGDDVMNKFWAAVDRISLAESKLPKVTEGPGGRKPLTYKQVLQKAAEEVSTDDKKFVIPLLPEDLKFIRADKEGNYRLSAKAKEHRAIINASGEDIKVGPPTVTKPATKPGAKLPEEEKPAPPPELDKSLEAAINNDDEGASLLLRENGLVGWLFGGSERSVRSWWENLMNWSTATTQGASEMGNTIRSGFAAIRFIARMFDDTRTQLAHLVGAGKKARATAMHFKSEEGRLMVSVIREWAKFTAMLPRMAPITRRALEMVMYETLYTNKTVTKDMLVKVGIPEFQAEKLVGQANEILKRARYANQAILNLEAETGRLISVDSDGKPINPNYFAPTQMDHEQIQNMKMPQFEQLVKDLVSARTKRKLNSPNLDRNTMVVMGWLDVKHDPKSNTYVLYAPNRVIKASESVNMFTAETLEKLKIGAIASTGMEGDAARIFKLMKIADPENYFVMQTDTGFNVYRVPKRLDDLTPYDAARYTEAVQGNVAMYTEAWRQRLGGKNLIEHEIREIIKQKTRQYPYNQTNTPDSIFKQPVMRLLTPGEQENMALPIKGLIPEEFMETELTKSVLRTNMAEAYYYFIHGRYFELAFQKQLNSMLGRKDKTFEDVLLVAENKAQKALDVMAEKENWTARQKEVISRSITDGVQRLREEYQFNADTLPYLQSGATGTARLMLAAMRYKLAPGFGISALVETAIEISKQSPNVFTIPKNLINVLRFVLLDKRFSKDALLKSEIGDTIFILESFRTDLSNRFMGEINQGAFKSDSRLGTRVADSISNIRQGETLGEQIIRTAEEGGRWMQSLGSLQAVTMATRELAKVRIQKLIWKYVNSGKLSRLYDLLTVPETATELAKLEKEAVNSGAAATALFKRFAGIAREAGITDANEAALFLKYGLTTKEQIRHLVWGIKQIGDADGRVNMVTLSELRNDLMDNPVPGIDPNTLGEAVSAYAFMVEDMITKTAVSELKGLNKVTRIDAKTPFGRVWYALSSWVRSFQDNVIMDFGSRSTGKYLVSAIFLYAAVEAINGLFKEWLAGRELEDIMEELEDNPSQFLFRGISRMPFFGVYNGFLEAGIAGMSAMTGGNMEYYGVPGMVGIGAGIGAATEAGRNITNIASGVYNRGELDVKSASKLFGAESIINRSPFAIPVRMLETAGAFREMEAIERYLKTVHKDPYPYMNKKRGETPVPTESLKIPERNLLLEEQRAKEALRKDQQRQSMIRQAQSIQDQQGVSGILGDILEGNK